MKSTPWALALTLAAAATGCGPQLGAVSAPPPTRDAEHNRNIFDDDVVHISQGVAIAFDCYEGFFPEMCREATARVEDPKTAKVYRAHLERQPDPYYMTPGIRQRSGFVLVGVTKGRTKLHVQSSQGAQDVTVIVE